MSDIVIKVDKVSKQYRLGQIGTGSLAHDMNRWWYRIRHKEDPYLKIGEVNDRTKVASSEYVWALQDIDFNVIHGDRLAIIGRNGAGKSTLLKILSRVTMPTTGFVKAKGRIASLLEVGTGFHPELTGRENIFLNGAILGMTKSEIKKKFDEIVEFSGVEKYIDTPVKRYSSGMYVRLAFAVAAHLESEILIVDEVLAVGDAEFQKKCLGKMNDVSKKQGRTVLFVSHNMAAVNQLCNRTVYLENGKISDIGETSKIVSNYLNEGGNTESYIDLVGLKANRSGNGKVEFTSVCLKKSTELSYNRIFSIGESVNISFTIKFNNPNQRVIQISIVLKTSDGFSIANMANDDSKFQVVYQEENVVSYEVALNDIRLYPDTYYLSLWAGDMSSTETYDFVEDCISFEIIDGGELTTRLLPRAAGLLFLTPNWIKR
jgi:lipopolysaccharide transport system ATP-binding protein